MIVYNSATVFTLSMTTMEYDVCLAGYHLIPCFAQSSHVDPLAEIFAAGHLHT